MERRSKSKGSGRPRPRLRTIRGWLTRLFCVGVKALRVVGILPRVPLPSQASEDRILIAHLTPHLGDTILVMPLIEALRAAHPRARIEYAADESVAPLLKAIPSLDRVYSFRINASLPKSRMRVFLRPLRLIRAYLPLRKELAPTICISPRWDDDSYRSHILSLLTGAPRRIGFMSPEARYRNAYLTQPILGASGLHESARFCWLAAEAGLISHDKVDSAPLQAVPSLCRFAEQQDWVRLAATLQIDRARPFAVIAPGASMLRRVWPSDRWAEVCRGLEAMGLAVVLLSGAADRALAENLHEAAGRRTILAAGKTSLPDTVTLLAHAALFLGSDSGPGHIAGALGRPTVTLSISEPGADPDGVASMQRLRPIGPDVECCLPPHCLKPCSESCTADHPHCITLIDPDHVLRAASAALARHPELTLEDSSSTV